MMKARFTYLDIETSPNVVLQWDLRSVQPTPVSMLVEPGQVLCFGWKHDQEKTLFTSVQDLSHEEMIWQAHQVLTETDILVTYNGDRFDIPWLNASFLKYKMPPPSPYKSLDLYKIAKRFQLPSRKLGYFSQYLGFEGKLQNSGIDLWTRCLAGDKRAWAEMRKYNIQDVELLPSITEELRAWFPQSINLGVYSGTDVCPSCGGSDLVKEGITPLVAGRYQRYSCRTCGRWSRSSRKLPEGTNLR